MKTLRFVTLGIVCLILWYSCVNHDLYPSSDDLKINLRWVKSYPNETRSQIVTGLAWNLSFLGAKLPKRSMKTSVRWLNESVFTLNISSVGFSQKAIQAIVVLLTEIKNSDEYKKTGAIDLGRFIVLTLNSSYHYYAITGAAATLNQYKNQYHFNEVKGAVINSSIATGHRIVSIAESDYVSKLAFIAEEGTGSAEAGNFLAEEFETLDVMPNGQLRFALYDIKGELKSGASQKLTMAGKPAKCLWCHEINIQSLNEMGSVPSYIPYETFVRILQQSRETIERYRTTLWSDIDFSRKQDHTQGELLYIGFMEPSVYRLANEWVIDREVVSQMLNGLATHAHEEFSFLGDQLYDRKTVDELSPYGVIRVPDDAREPSLYEPEIIRP
jgi:hypothetical protein